MPIYMYVYLVFNCMLSQAMMLGSLVSWLEALLGAILLGCAPRVAEATVRYLSSATLPKVPFDSVLRVPGLYAKTYLSVKWV